MSERRSEPDKIHAADQIGASLRLTAKILGEYRDELERGGFSEDAQIALCIEMQRILTQDKP